MLIKLILVSWAGAFIGEQVELEFRRRNRKIISINSRGGTTRKALSELLEKITSDGKLKGVVGSTMAWLLYELAGQKLITAIINAIPGLLNLNMTEVIDKGFPNITQLKDGYEKLGGREVAKAFNIDPNLSVPQ